MASWNFVFGSTAPGVLAPAAGVGAYPALTLLLLALGTLASEDLACIGGGLLVARGALAFWPATLACLLGIYIGDVLLYAAGRHWGRPVLRYAPFRWCLRESDLQRAGDHFQRHGGWWLFVARFVPSLRLPMFVGAGILHFPFSRFLGILLVAAAIWTPALVWISTLVGVRMTALFTDYAKTALLGTLAAGLTVLVLVRVVIPLCTWRGRRIWLSRWRRLTRWEYWPWWAIYPPVILYIIWLGLKHRGLTVFTCANPAMPAGGFLGESKSDILRGLSGAGDMVARWTLLPASTRAGVAEARLAALETWMQKKGLAWPVVLKPDIGERGQGVAICRERAQAAAYLAANHAAVIAQEYIPGVEYGVFYYRFPQEASGHILAVTDKRFPAVTGDGVHSLEWLILRDDRAVGSARFFLECHAAQLTEIPAAGVVIPLAELGTHSRGALFLDGTAALATPELARAIDAISRAYSGFYFGRYDVRAPSAEDFAAGRNLRVIELNGVTSEATSIYDPRNSLARAQAMLCRQWALCFAIGAANREHGVMPESPTQLWRTYLHHRREEKFEA